MHECAHVLHSVPIPQLYQPHATSSKCGTTIPLTRILAQEVWMDNKANDCQDQHTEGQDGANDNEHVVSRNQVEVDGIRVLSSIVQDGANMISQLMVVS